MAVAERIPLGVADSVGVMTDGARRILIDNMLLMLGKTLVAQDAAPAMAFITHGIIGGTFRRVIERDIIALQQKVIDGAMGTLWPVGIVGTMAIYAGDRAGNRQRG
jgi:hypothetical protein